MTPTEYVREWIERIESYANEREDQWPLDEYLKQALAVVRDRFEEINEMLNLSRDYPSPYDLMADLARTLGWDGEP